MTSLVRLGLAVALFPFVGVFTLPAAPVPFERQAVEKELKKLRGEWTLVKHVDSEGRVSQYRPADGPSQGHFCLTIEGEKATTEIDYTDPPYLIDEAVALKVDRMPKWISLTVTDASSFVDLKRKGQTRLGVYELDGDRLTLCVTDYGATKRPLGFQHGEHLNVYELKRVKR